MKSKQMFILPMIIVAFLFLLTLAANSLHPTRYIKCDTNKLTVEKAHLEDGEAVIEKIKIPKGTKVKVKVSGKGYVTLTKTYKVK